jgi:hypothetical protein
MTRFCYTESSNREPEVQADQIWTIVMKPTIIVPFGDWEKNPRF